VAGSLQRRPPSGAMPASSRMARRKARRAPARARVHRDLSRGPFRVRVLARARVVLATRAGVASGRAVEATADADVRCLPPAGAVCPSGVDWGTTCRVCLPA
jgi:hypothetical protein